MDGIGGGLYMGTVLVVIFLTTAVFIPALQRGNRAQFGVCMLGTFLLIYVGSAGLEVGTVRSLLVALVMTAIFALACWATVWFQQRSERRRLSGSARTAEKSREDGS